MYLELATGASLLKSRMCMLVVVVTAGREAVATAAWSREAGCTAVPVLLAPDCPSSASAAPSTAGTAAARSSVVAADASFG